MYLMNVLDFKLSQLGIEEIDFEIDKNAFATQLNDKERHEKAKASGQNKVLDKIVFGIAKIDPSKKAKQDLKEENSE